MTLADTAGGPEVIVGALTIIGLFTIWMARKGYRIAAALVHLAEIITGKPAVGREPAVPGIAARLANIEYELKTNGGGSLKDLVTDTHKLAGVNAENVEQARLLAEQAVQKAEELATRTAEAETAAKQERLLQQQALDGLLAGLDDFADDVHSKDMAYQRALRALGYDITKITDELTEEVGDGR